MVSLFGLLTVFSMVFGGYLLAGGELGIIIKSLPFEMMMIGGAAVGAFLISNGIVLAKQALCDLKKAFSGPRWKVGSYQELLCLLFELLRLSRHSPIDLEEHIEKPSESSVFLKYSDVGLDSYAIEMICDTLRSASMNYDDPHQVEEVLERRVSSIKEGAQHSSHALQNLADGLPALGIVAAVLGVIKTMGSIDQPPEVLGKLIGGALVGTFLGVFLAYGIVGPFAGRLRSVAEEEVYLYELIQCVLVANLYKHSTNICIEVGRQSLPSRVRPDFSSLEEALRAAKKGSE